MTLIKNFSLNTNNATGDAFGRLRGSRTGQRLDVEFLYDKHEDIFDEVIAGSGSIALAGNTRDLTLAVGDAVNGSSAEHASHPVPYTPGNGQLIESTGVLDYAAIGGGTAEYFIRTSITGSAVETAIEQSNWSNLTSGIDWADSHIFGIDFQSLKVGRIRYFLNQGGISIFVGEIINDNVRNSGYWQIASLPSYWKIYNSGGITYAEVGYGNDDNAVGFRYKFTANASATMKAICTTVKSEGGVDLTDLPGLPRSASNQETTVTASTTLVPILSIRAKSTWNTYDNLKIGLPKSFTISASNPVRVVVMHDTTLTTPSWTSVNASSAFEYDVSATAVSGGHEVYNDYVTTVANNRANSQGGLLGKTVLWNRKSTVAGQTGILTVAAIRTGGTDASCLAALNWEEI